MDEGGDAREPDAEGGVGRKNCGVEERGLVTGGALSGEEGERGLWGLEELEGLGGAVRGTEMRLGVEEIDWVF